MLSLHASSRRFEVEQIAAAELASPVQENLIQDGQISADGRGMLCNLCGDGAAVRSAVSDCMTANAHSTM